MAQIILTISIVYRHRWLGMAFLRLSSIPVYLGVGYSAAQEKWIANTAYHLMGPRAVTR